jgi:uncharacterized protein
MNEALSVSAAEGMSADGSVAVAPVTEGSRIETLDFIRGLAVMGILAANIVAFGQPFEAYMYPTAFKVDAGDPGGWMWIAQFCCSARACICSWRRPGPKARPAGFKRGGWRS